MASKYKVSTTIIDENMALIGLLIKGKEKDLVGGLSETEVEVPKSLQDLASFNNGAGFRNRQITITKNGFNELSNFKLNSLPMLVFNKATNSYNKIPNGVALVARIVQGKETVGFKVKFESGNEGNYTYSNVVALSTWFRPTNFSVRTRVDLEKNTKKSYISGNGISLSDLPAINVVGADTDNAKTRGKSVQQAKRKDNILGSDFDILDVYELLCKYHGQVIKLPGEKYVPASYSASSTPNEFVSLGIGEVASPKLQFNATKLNINAGFKKVGYVPVTFRGARSNITTFTYATKSLFVAGESYIKTFGIAVPTMYEADLINELGKSLALEKITDNTIIQPLSSVIDADALVFYKVTSKGLDLISESKLKSAVLGTPEIVKTVKELSCLKIMEKALGTYGLLAILKETPSGEAAIVEAYNRSIAPNLALYSNEILAALNGLGFNIYTGAYQPKVEASKSESSSSKADGSEKVEIVYTVEGYDPGKFTGKTVLNNIETHDIEKLPLSADQIKLIARILNIKDDREQAKAAKEALEGIKVRIDELSKKMWMHNAAQFIIGKKTNIHSTTTHEWEFMKSLKTGDVYRNKLYKALTVKVKGVSIAV